MADLGTDVRSLFTANVVDLDPYFQIVSGATAVAHAVARRFLTPAGSLVWDEDVGLDLRDWLLECLSRAQLPAIASMVRTEALKEERVDSATADVTLGASGVLTVTLSCTTAAGPFVLVLAASALTVDLLSIR